MTKAEKYTKSKKNTTKKAKRTKKNTKATAGDNGTKKKHDYPNRTKHRKQKHRYWQLHLQHMRRTDIQGDESMLILSFVEKFETEAFKENFDIEIFDRVKAISWTRQVALSQAQHIVKRLSEKSNWRTKALDKSVINTKDDKVLSELGTKQVLQAFRASLTMHAYSVRDRRVGESIQVMFADIQCPM